MHTLAVPFINLQLQYKALKKEIDEALISVAGSGWYLNEENTKTFEGNFARYLGTKHCLGTDNGSDSLKILLKAMDIGTGDEVIVPAHSWFSCTSEVINSGAHPVFADIDPTSFNIALDSIEPLISNKTKAILVVHLYGQIADISAIKRLCEQKKILLIEDCAQAHGAALKDQKAGSIGDAAIFSFYPTKNLGAMGNAGCIVTNNTIFAEKVKIIQNQGQKIKNRHTIIGMHSKMDGLQAAVLNVKLPCLDQWNNRRIAIADYYNELLKDYVAVPTCPEKGSHVFHHYVIRSKYRDPLQRSLRQNNIESIVQYPTPMPFQPAMQHFKKIFPNASKICQEILSLPMYPELTDDQVSYVGEKTKNFFNVS